MQDLIPYRGGNLDRRVSRSLDRFEAEAAIIKRSDALRIECAVERAERGLAGIAHLSAIEGMYVGMVPHAEARLRAAADGASLMITNLIMER